LPELNPAEAFELEFAALPTVGSTLALDVDVVRTNPDVVGAVTLFVEVEFVEVEFDADAAVADTAETS
jgi:hypothetical protein